jgi:hypothetical protein
MSAVSTESRLRLRAPIPRVVVRDLSHQTELAARVARSAHRHEGHGVIVERERDELDTDEHACTCHCVECDPDTYRDMESEILAGQRDW